MDERLFEARLLADAMIAADRVRAVSPSIAQLRPLDEDADEWPLPSGVFFRESAHEKYSLLYQSFEKDLKRWLEENPTFELPQEIRQLHDDRRASSPASVAHSDGSFDSVAVPMPQPPGSRAGSSTPAPRSRAATPARTMLPEPPKDPFAQRFSSLTQEEHVTFLDLHQRYEVDQRASAGAAPLLPPALIARYFEMLRVVRSFVLHMQPSCPYRFLLVSVFQVRQEQEDYRAAVYAAELARSDDYLRWAGPQVRERVEVRMPCSRDSASLLTVACGRSCWTAGARA
jgi:hypothetical protein